MIVPMKKVSLLCLASDSESTLEALREMGILHLAPVTPPASAELETSQKRHEEAVAARAVLDVVATSKAAEHTPPQDLQTQVNERPADAIVDRIQGLTVLRKEFVERITALRDEEKIIRPYGDYDPAVIEALAEKSVHVRLYQVPGKQMPEPPEGVSLFPIAHDAAGWYFAAISQAEFECEACEHVPHHRPLSVVQADISQAEGDLEHVKAELVAFSVSRQRLDDYMQGLEEQLGWLQARDGMGASGKLAYLKGFCPHDLESDVRQAATTHGWGLVIEDPGADEEVPTLIRTPKWIQPIKTLFTVLEVLPGYKELDVSAPFLLFFSIFFAIIVGDAGYGLIFLLLTLWARKKNPTAAPGPFWLMGILSTSTIIWGVITGNYFGAPLENLPALGTQLKISWLGLEENLFVFCFLMGAIHLTVAHAMQAIANPRGTRILSQVGWICMTWVMYFMAKLLIMAIPAPSWTTMVFITGLVLVLVDIIARFKTQWTSLATLAFDVINNFSDVVSYIRLFAVGAAGLAVAQAFNELAFASQSDAWWSALAVGAILFVGHALNMVLCIMSVLVHGVRLNTLEFSGHAGLAWTGFAYNPFRKLTKKG